ncbi:hypothetical protein Esti_006493 [Eimeria stiedai]
MSRRGPPDRCDRGLMRKTGSSVTQSSGEKHRLVATRPPLAYSTLRLFEPKQQQQQKQKQQHLLQLDHGVE